MVRPYRASTRASDGVWGWHCSMCGQYYRDKYDAKRCCGLEREVKTRILKRDGKKCVICGSTAQLNIHHFWDGHFGSYVLGEKEGTPYHNTRDEELVTLCTSCHMKVHSMPGKTLAKLLTEIISQRFGKGKPSLILVEHNGEIKFISPETSTCP